MAKSKTVQEGRKVYIIKRTIDVVFAAILVIGIICLVMYVTGDKNDSFNHKKMDNGDKEISEDGGKVDKRGDMIFSSELMDDDDIFNGTLILVNNDNEYKGKGEDLVSVYDVKDKDGTESYTVMSADVKLKKDAADALNEMLKAFAKETGRDDIVVDGGYRSKEEQQELFNAAEDKSAAAKPGFSDYHAGYSIDFGISGADGMVEDFDGTGDYSWFEENSYKYGYILRYPDGKKDSTGYDYRPWHFRYVGKEHAYYIVKNSLCLEEYVEQVRTYSYENDHLTFQDDDNNYYEVYYYPKDEENKDMTMVAVPSGIPYTISGDNKDGFIIAFDKYANVTPEGETKPSGEKDKPAETKAENDSDNASDEGESEE